GVLHTPAGAQVQVKVRDPEGKEIASQQVTLTRYGTFTLDATVPKSARLGQFGIEAVKFAGGSFLVAEYRAPQFRVDVQVPKAELTAGDELTGTVIARYLFGGAMDGAQVQWSAGRTTEDFAPPRNAGFRFGRNTWNWDDNQPAHDNGAFASGQGAIGRDGTLAVKAGKLEAPGDRAARYTLEAEVADVSRQRVAGRASLLVHPAAFYVGLGATSLFVKAGDTLAIPVIAAAPNGDRVDARVHVTAFLRSWHSVRKRGVSGIFETLSEPVEEKAAECEVQSDQDCKLPLAKPGFYNLRAEGRDSAGRLALTTASLYAIGGGFAAWQQNDSNKVEIVADKTSYEVGETAHLLIKSPYPSCRGLISVEREGIADARVVELSGTASTIDVPIREEHVPNVFVGAILVRERVKDGGAEAGDDPGRPSMRFGYVGLKVGTGSKRLKVSVATPKAEYRPREKVPVDIAVSQPAEVQLDAVDDAVLRLTGYQLPDPVSAFFPDHALAVTIGEPLPRLVRRQKFGEKGEVQPGGGGGMGPSGDIRSNFVTTVLWKTLETDASGKAHAEIELPDNLTTFRILAVATTGGEKAGAAQTEVRVSLPLLVRPALPRFARVGDEFEAGVAVHSVKTFDVKVSVDVDGLQLTGDKQRTGHVEAGVAKEVRFKFKAATAGKATVRFRATAGDLTDAVQETIPIQLPVEMEAVAVAGDTTATKTEGLVPPQGVRKDAGGLELSLASTALGGLREAMDQLVEYPYGCVEQLSSRLVPFVATREVERVFGQPPHPDQVVTDTVAKIEALQAPSGGFLYWPSATCPYAWPSIYATLALARA
ncbi:MAG: alpha-2-macroglobulin, partial [Deltaproteobacteria bacterium]